jgi:hypothetical protein
VHVLLDIMYQRMKNGNMQKNIYMTSDELILIVEQQMGGNVIEYDGQVIN